MIHPINSWVRGPIPFSHYSLSYNVHPWLSLSSCGWTQTGLAVCQDGSQELSSEPQLYSLLARLLPVFLCCHPLFLLQHSVYLQPALLTVHCLHLRIQLGKICSPYSALFISTIQLETICYHYSALFIYYNTAWDNLLSLNWTFISTIQLGSICSP